MKNIFSLLILIIFISCGNTASEKETALKNINPTQNEIPANDAVKSASIKILKNDKVVAEYKPTQPEAYLVTDKSGEKTISINLGSDDNTYALIVTVNKAASGNYSIGKEGADPVQIQLVTEGKGVVPFMTNLTDGTFKITLTGETCSGNFTGIQKEAGMDNIGITGDFTSIPLTKKTINY